MAATRWCHRRAPHMGGIRGSCSKLWGEIFVCPSLDGVAVVVNKWAGLGAVQRIIGERMGIGTSTDGDECCFRWECGRTGFRYSGLEASTPEVGDPRPIHGWSTVPAGNAGYCVRLDLELVPPDRRSRQCGGRRVSRPSEKVGSQYA